jgi:ABC-type multidrug transport system fused ATPase/permease subunit
MPEQPLGSAGVFFFYGGLCRKVLVGRTLFSGFLFAATLQGIGHGLMAMAAASLGTALGRDSPRFLAIFGLELDPLGLAFVGVAATCAKGAGSVVGTTLQSRLSQNVAGWVRRDLAARLLSTGSSLAPGQLAARLSIGLTELERGVADGFLGGLRACLALVPLGVALALVSSRLAWGAMLLLVPFGLLLSVARRSWKRSYVRALSVAENIHREVDELVAHMDVWRAYGAAEPVRRSLDELAQQAAHSASRAEGARAALSSANEVLAALTLLVCIAAAHWISLPLGDGTLIAFAVPFFMAYRPLRDLGDARTALERGATALETLEATVRPAIDATGNVATLHSSRDTAGTTTSAEHGVASRAATTNDTIASRIDKDAIAPWQLAVLEVRDVGVVRDDDADGARTSFVLRPGELLAVVGPTGSGKTTLLRALLGLEPDTVGSIRYGEVELARAAVGPHARPFAWAPQEAALLAGTLEENVLLSRHDGESRETPGAPLGAAGAGRPDVAGVLASVGAERLVRACGAVPLGAAGRALSGGERKWIALARALASTQPVLLLDEPTAGLDTAAQEIVIAALRRGCNARSIIVVTHRRDAARWADRVVAIGSCAIDQNWASIRGSFSNSSRTSGMS